MANFKRYLKEGDTVKIENFTVCENVPHKWQKARVDHACKLNFGYVTKVLLVKPDLFISTNGFNFVPFEAIDKDPNPYYIGKYIRRFPTKSLCYKTQYEHTETY